MSYTIVGVVGHIDHGKTSLVGVLTGVDTDTHPEEKLRGITIDLGFASFDEAGHQFALIDAPGHQKYIGNLLAGVSGVDIGLLVVACDQGIQQQTLEHAAILQSLGVTNLIAVISRIDLCDEAAQLELAEELEVFLADYGFQQVPTIPVSSVTGQGIEQLRAQLCRFARDTDRIQSGRFRMPIDRVFSVPGRGCVVAGTVWSGVVNVGDTLELAGRDQQVRVRELEAHGHPVERSGAGYRTAMNVTGVAAGDLSRGDELVATETHRVASRLVAEIRLFPDAPKLKCPTTVQFHSATVSCSAQISGVRELVPGSTAIAVIDTAQPVVATYSQSFLLRHPFPIGSFAGGRVLAPLIDVPADRRRLVEFGRQLVQASPADRLLAWVNLVGEMQIDPVRFELELGIAADQYSVLVDALVRRGEVLMPLEGRLVAPLVVTRIGDYAVKVLRRQAEHSDDAWFVEASLIDRVRSTGSIPVIGWVIDRLAEDKKIVRVNQMIAIASEENLLSKKQKARMNELIRIFDGNRAPPTVKEVAEQLQTTPDAIASLLRFCAQQGLLIDLGGGFLIARSGFIELCRELQELFNRQAECSVADIRDRWNITRKHAIPLLEYCDKIGVTVRQGNGRLAGPRLPTLVTEQEQAVEP